MRIDQLVVVAGGGTNWTRWRPTPRWPERRVPDGVLLDELLESLRRDRQHLALVVDEHDKAVGIITLEDVLEEIVGEIEDEFDPEPDRPTRHPAGHRVPADGEEAG